MLDAQLVGALGEEPYADKVRTKQQLPRRIEKDQRSRRQHQQAEGQNQRRQIKAGLRDIEVTSFVSPKWVPQMSDNAEVMAGIRRQPGVRYSVLVPNMKGLEGALASRPDEIAGYRGLGWGKLDPAGLGSLAVFDPIAGFAWAQAAARAWSSDAQIESVYLEGVRADGTLDLTAGGRSADYRFVSPGQLFAPGMKLALGLALWALVATWVLRFGRGELAQGPGGR